MHATSRLWLILVCLVVAGLTAALVTACDGEEEEAATATPTAANRLQ